jgi:hypothetical protein
MVDEWHLDLILAILSFSQIDLLLLIYGGDSGLGAVGGGMQSQWTSFIGYSS